MWVYVCVSAFLIPMNFAPEAVEVNLLLFFFL